MSQENRVVTVTINPAIDQTVAIPNFTAGAVNRVQSSQLDAGGKGVSIGRNVFQHRNIIGITKAISGIVLEDMDVEEALKILK